MLPLCPTIIDLNGFFRYFSVEKGKKGLLLCLLICYRFHCCCCIHIIFFSVKWEHSKWEFYRKMNEIRGEIVYMYALLQHTMEDKNWRFIQIRPKQFSQTYSITSIIPYHPSMYTDRCKRRRQVVDIVYFSFFLLSLFVILQHNIHLRRSYQIFFVLCREKPFSTD